MKEISMQFFSECPELEIIEQQFPVKNISKEINRRDIECQFELLRALTETKKHKLRLRMNTISENKKNRYPEQSIYEETRIKLQRPEADYINANKIMSSKDKRLIITQGPLELTCKEFYDMLEQQQIQCVVMLCQCVQNNKVRCFDYLASLETLEKDEPNKSIEIRSIKLLNRKFTHIYYKNWPDRGVPTDMEDIKIIIQEMMKYGKICIHCSAGLGRSGVIAAILNLILAGDNISIFGEVRKLRQSRYQSVQNNHQYRFIYQYLAYHYANSSNILI